MNSIDELPRNEKLEKLIRMMVTGRIDAGIKLAQILEAEFVRLEKTKKVPAK